MSDSIDVTEKLKTFLNDRYSLKTKVKNAVSNSYPLNLGNTFENYGSEISKLYGKDICGVNAADAMYPWSHPEYPLLRSGSFDINDVFIKSQLYAEQGGPDCPLHKLNRRNKGKQVTIPGVRELKIKSLDKFNFWFIGLECESAYFPELEKIEYTSSESSAFACPIYAPRLKSMSKNCGTIYVDVNNLFSGSLPDFSYKGLNENDLSAFYPMIENGQATDYVVPSGSKTSIGRYAFNGFYKLENITIPETITRIEDSAFESCNMLEEFTIPQSVVYIGKRAFYTASSMPKNITFEGKTMEEVQAMENYPWNVSYDVSTFICTDGTITVKRK